MANLTASHPTLAFCLPLLNDLFKALIAQAWPILASTVLYAYKAEVRKFISLLLERMSRAEITKIGPLELAYKVAAREAKVADSNKPIGTDVPTNQIQASKALKARVDLISIDPKEKLAFARFRLTKLSIDYELLRKNEVSSPHRTREMNRIISLMRTFALPAFPGLLRNLTSSKIAGERLAAIAILQVKSSKRYIGWLGERFKLEDQAFILFHAALALLRMARLRRFAKLPELRMAIEDGIKTVKSFRGIPDQNTLEALNQALVELATREHSHESTSGQ